MMPEIEITPLIRCPLITLRHYCHAAAATLADAAARFAAMPMLSRHC